MIAEKTATEIALERLESALADLRSHRADYHPNTYQLIEEPIKEEIERYRLLLTGQKAERPNPTATPEMGVANIPALDPNRHVVPE